MKIFRSFRQGSLQNGKLKRYVIYAIGEILLVMIGILLALQVNNWNQNKINHKKEIKALIDLKNEFELNESRILEKQQSRIEIGPIIKDYVRLISRGKANYNSFKEFHSNPLMFGMTNPSNGVIGALISSGEISLISNDSLKYYLADWKNQMENLYENEQILWDSGLGFIGCTSDKIPNPSQNWEDWNLNKLRLASDELISSVQYRNYLVGFEGCNDIVIEECQMVITVLDEIIKRLNSEIGKHE